MNSIPTIIRASNALADILISVEIRNREYFGYSQWWRWGGLSLCKACHYCARGREGRAETSDPPFVPN